jgi:serine/threonine protein kinase
MRRTSDSWMSSNLRSGTPPSDICAPTIEHSHLPEIGTQIGPYKLLQVIGEGGMGVVYMAEQTKPVRRRVALKIIKPGMDSRQVIARFEAERQALAMMDHPNIAKVLDAGTTADGHPYFVMELVKGVPITTYCDEQHLTPRERLQLFVSVCQAVQHAHQKGVIHRDLKPSNVLVAHYDNKPVPKVIDFGLAKATGQQLTEKTLVTFFGQVTGAQLPGTAWRVFSHSRHAVSVRRRLRNAFAQYASGCQRNACTHLARWSSAKSILPRLR